MIKMGRHYQRILCRGARRKSGGDVTQDIAGKLLSTAVMVVIGIAHIVAVSGCWLAIMILPQQTLPLPQNGTMKGTMRNCQNILRGAVRKKSGGDVIKATAGFPLSITVHLGTDVPIAAAGLL